MCAILIEKYVASFNHRTLRLQFVEEFNGDVLLLRVVMPSDPIYVFGPNAWYANSNGAATRACSRD